MKSRLVTISVAAVAIIAAALPAMAQSTHAAAAPSPALYFAIGAICGAGAAWGASVLLRRKPSAPAPLPAKAAASLASVRENQRDPLTQLPNRVKFESRVNSRLKEGHALAVLAVDIDGFTALNEQIGFARGDRLLQELGERLHRALHDKEAVAHIYGDTFTILAEGAKTPEDSEALALHVLRACADPFTHEGENLTISVSIGIAHAPYHGNNAADLLKASTHALHAIKAQGHGKWGFYDG
jgi:diguanylate cyclase (GGDEF)-like protein